MTIPRDKLKHFAAGLGIATGVAVLSRNPALPIITAGFLGLAKEAYDWAENYVTNTQTHDPSLYDALATAAGGVIPSLFLILG